MSDVDARLHDAVAAGVLADDSTHRGLLGSIEAQYEDGVLTVKVPKPEEAKPKRISIGHRSKTIDAGASA